MWSWVRAPRWAKCESATAFSFFGVGNLAMLPARLAQSVERKALNLVVVGSSPTVGKVKAQQAFILFAVVWHCIFAPWVRPRGGQTGKRNKRLSLLPFPGVAMRTSRAHRAAGVERLVIRAVRARTSKEQYMRPRAAVRPPQRRLGRLPRHCTQRHRVAAQVAAATGHPWPLASNGWLHHGFIHAAR